MITGRKKLPRSYVTLKPDITIILFRSAKGLKKKLQPEKIVTDAKDIGLE